MWGVGFEMIPDGLTGPRWIPWVCRLRWTFMGDTGARATDDYGISPTPSSR